ncbi:Fps/Fes/Fer/CIP4-like protein [Metarhizium album ARSEF 1941]|uniref:Protein BZZ1 n=1 Tax=Metarhizium album (strain ARSEF 1941) TaxID=1081103 RepID=A0A0B2WLI8_METAS|nr:Fps/Fes/Fer/CIP4-like protein [Metarhizium album ARSEF 1941]KHN93885.1 Fps/Fes/Fer/CIP4-like protein [Metarhizium album ARSEF 1941]
MAEVEGLPTFGPELKASPLLARCVFAYWLTADTIASDGFKPASAWVGHGIAWLEDIQQFYRDRSLIEKEYAAKLSALARKYFEKKNKKSSQLSVGDTPTMTPGSLESASLTTWSTQLKTLESRAAEHDKYGSLLVSQVAEPLKYYAARFEELRKRHVEYADKLAAERDASYGDLRKVKANYDSVCHEVETRRKKSESHQDKAKAQSAYQQQIYEMNNAKNSYIIAINVTNKHKEKYYHEYVPEAMDSIQHLHELRTLKLNGLWDAATKLEGTMLRDSLGMMDHLAHEVGRNLPHLDSLMYMRHNMGSFQEPADKEFEPSPVWHDDAIMVVDETAKVYLRNVLSKSKSQLGELRREVDKKRREVEAAKKLKQRVRDGTENKDEVEVVRSLLAMQEELHSLDRQRLTAEVETGTITAVVGDVTLGAKSHNFKSQTYRVPTNCDLCGERIWGLSAKGFDCRDCGYTCHSKCQMKVPADCPGEQSKEERKKLKAERQEAANRLVVRDPAAPLHVADVPGLTRSNTMNSLSSHSARRSVSGSVAKTEVDAGEPPLAPRPSLSPNLQGSTASPSAAAAGTRKRMAAPPPSSYIGEAPAGGVNGNGNKEEKKGKMLYAFDASGDGELSVAEGRDVTLLEPDDGSGWVKVRAGYKEGMVPASYVDFTAAPAVPTATRPESTYSTSTTSSAAPSTGPGGKKKGPAVAPRRGAKKLKYVEALYEYAAQSADEHSMVGGERFVLVKEDPGDGWVEVEKAGVTGSVPASYVQVV